MEMNKSRLTFFFIVDIAILLKIMCIGVDDGDYW